MQAKRLILAGATVACVAAGCGGTSHSSGRLSRAELITQADNICARVNAKIAANPIRSTRALAELAPQLSAYGKAAASELGKLTPPSALASDWHEFVTDYGRVAQSTADLGKAFAAGNRRAAPSFLRQAVKTQQAMLALAKRDGFDACSVAA
jgi:hypothetical protein